MKKIILLLVLFSFYACQQDDIVGSDPIEINEDSNATDQDDIAFQSNFGGQINADFVGRIFDEDGNLLNNVDIKIGDAMTTTNQFGVFVLNNVSVREHFAYVRAFKDGFLDGSRTLVPVQNGSNTVRITLLRPNIVATLESGSLTEVSWNDSKVIFPGDYITENGDPYSGLVDVSLHYLKPNEADTFMQMPGSLFGQELDNDAVAMETYGMLAVNLFSQSGERLNIDAGAPATLEMPVDPDQMAIAPDIMNLWSFDEELGYWKEEGVGIKEGNKYVGEVSHFSWWNYDLPIDYINACVSLVSADGVVPNLYVSIVRDLNGQTIYAGYSNETGRLCGPFPNNETVTISFWNSDECGFAIFYEESIGPMNEGDLISVEIPENNFSQTSISSLATNCEGEPITEGYAFIYANTENSMFGNALVVSINDGTISTSLQYCSDEPTNFNIIVYDLENDLNSGIVPFLLEAGSNDLGVLSTCIETGGYFNGDAILHTQEEVNNFGLLGFLGINGKLVIGFDGAVGPGNGFSNISDISALGTLTDITDEVVISRNPNLSSLSGLQSLVSTGGLTVHVNEVLTDLLPLSNLSGQLDAFYLNGNTNLTDVAGLEGITDIGFMVVQANDNLQNFNGLQNVLNIDYIFMTSNESLISIEAFSQITSLGSLALYNNFELESLNGMHNLSSLDNLELAGNTSITTLEGMDGLSSLNNVWIDNMSGLTNLDGLDNLTSANYLNISNNSNLTSLNGLQNLTSVTVSLNIGIDDQGFNGGNEQLTNYCVLQNLLINGTYGEIVISNNAYNPTVQNIIDGNCSL